MSDQGLVLVIEDEMDIRNLIAINLRKKGFAVITAETGEEGLLLAKQQNPLVTTLDLMLPGINGLEVCKRIRENPDTSGLYVIMVTALGEVDDRIAGLQVGADDYVPKPFRVEELVLRVQAAAKRMRRGQSPSIDDGPIEKGRLRVDNSQHRIWIDDEEINMTITEYKLLYHLLQKENNLCSRGELLQEVWELPPNLNTRTVDTHVKRLRQKMGPICDYIETVRGAGYRFHIEE
jgi:two-component system phosphate regulon response regulator PhoB